MMLQVCYVVVTTGWDHHTQMAWLSASSVRRQEPSARITVLLEGLSPGAVEAATTRLGEVVDEVRVLSSPVAKPVDKSRYLKILAPEHLSGDFLYLDSDTLAVAPFADVTQTPGEVAAVTDFNSPIECHWFPPDMRESFEALGWTYPLPYYLNAGVIWFRDRDRVRQFCRDWLHRWGQLPHLPHVGDQASFNSALFAADLPHAVLPTAFNAMVVKRNYRFRSAKILHFFGSAIEQQGTLMAHLMDHLAATGRFDDAAYARSLRHGHPWGPVPQAWQLWKSRNYLRAVLAKSRQIVRQATGGK
jgi:hypothetical protein